MTIIDFYKELSRILTDTREEFLSRSQGEKKLEDLLDRAETAKLNVKVDKSILDTVNLMRLDDENSFKPEEEIDYDSDYSFGGESSY